MKENNVGISTELGKVIRIDSGTAHDGLCGTDKILRSLSLLREELTAWVSGCSQPGRETLPLKGEG